MYCRVNYGLPWGKAHTKMSSHEVWEKAPMEKAFSQELSDSNEPDMLRAAFGWQAEKTSTTRGAWRLGITKVWHHTFFFFSFLLCTCEKMSDGSAWKPWISNAGSKLRWRKKSLLLENLETEITQDEFFKHAKLPCSHVYRLSCSQSCLFRGNKSNKGPKR